jgi:hypothetical protein
MSACDRCSPTVLARRRVKVSSPCDLLGPFIVELSRFDRRMSAPYYKRPHGRPRPGIDEQCLRPVIRRGGVYLPGDRAEVLKRCSTSVVQQTSTATLPTANASDKLPPRGPTCTNDHGRPHRQEFASRGQTPELGLQTVTPTADTNGVGCLDPPSDVWVLSPPVGDHIGHLCGIFLSSSSRLHLLGDDLARSQPVKLLCSCLTCET